MAVLAMQPNPALTGGPLFTTIDPDGQTHDRSTFAKADACPAPDWVSQIGSSGGPHNVGTCNRCLAAWYLKIHHERTGVAASWQEKDEQFLAELAKIGREPYQLSQRELDYLTSRQAARIMRVAERAPLRRLPQLLRETRLMATVIATQLQDRHSKNPLSPEQRRLTEARYFVVKQSASVMWERLKHACEDVSLAYRLRRYLPAESPYEHMSLPLR